MEKDYREDKRIVLTLDAGGTNFVFSALQGGRSIVEPVKYSSQSSDLKKCLDNILHGFKEINNKLAHKPSAISFAFPGPANYEKGIIGNLPNLPAFEGGVALGPFLEKEFGIPVFINNDGNLFAYGEAQAGYLPYINSRLRESGSPKRYNNLIGITLGTGLGGGLVHKKELIIGDNSNAGEIWILKDIFEKERNIEESISIRAVQRNYSNKAGIDDPPTPKEIYEIAQRELKGDKESARKVYKEMGKALGEILVVIATIIDGLIIIGGGLSGASSLFLPSTLDVMNGKFSSNRIDNIPRLVTNNYNLEKEEQLEDFLTGENMNISIPGNRGNVTYDPEKRIGVGISKMGTSNAISTGAYIFAINELDNREN